LHLSGGKHHPELRNAAKQSTDLENFHTVCWGLEGLDDHRVAQQRSQLKLAEVADFQIQAQLLLEII